MGKVFIGMETSGQLRRRFVLLGHDVISCDLLEADDGGFLGRHIVGDVFETLDTLKAQGWWPHFAFFHPDCTYLTVSANWAYKDPDYAQYPGVGYHMKIGDNVLKGAARRAARERALDDIRRIEALPIELKGYENPSRGAINKAVRTYTQEVHPYEFGDDASKATGLWLTNLPPLVKDPSLYIQPIEYLEAGRWVRPWANQAPSGAPRGAQTADRWQVRSKTYDGIADAITTQYHPLITRLTALDV